MFLGLLMCLMAACGSQVPEQAGAPKDKADSPAPLEPLSSIEVADPKAASQLLSGFHAVEQGAWRWTEKKFSVVLKTLVAAERRVCLELKFTIPPPSIDALKALTLSAAVNGVPIGEETFDQAGQHSFTRPVPADALKEVSAQVDFELDKAIPPGDRDTRELGIVATSVGFKFDCPP